ncbi:MAG: M48 family metalloprotease [Theionarchaea archaeon]|nr:M48 family metalloprotease [Theionarchaea archaeon]
MITWWSGERKTIIDQTESDVRIFLLIVLMMGIYFLFVSTALIYVRVYLFTLQVKFLLMGTYLLAPVVIGSATYVLIPRMCEKDLDLSEGSPQESIKSVLHLLVLESPAVKFTSRRIPPFVYGRRKRRSVLVYPHHMDSFLSPEERKAVLLHELSHIKQGDVGFFTWLTLLLDGLKYWVIFYPFTLLGDIPLFSIHAHTVGVSIIIPLSLIPFFLLKQSLSRTRESIADAYVIFHGSYAPLAGALFKYSALQTMVKSSSSRLWFSRGIHRFSSRIPQVLASHPSFQKRLADMETKAFIREKSHNLSPPLAVWTGITAAILFYAFKNGIITVLVAIVYTFSDLISEILWMVAFLVVAGTTALSHIFPTTKSALYFSDLGHKEFIFPLIRNWGLTMGTAGFLFYCLTGSWLETRLFLTAVLGGAFFWIMGFASSRPTDFSTNTRYIIWGPIIWICILVYPAYRIGSIFFVTDLLSLHFLVSLFGIILFLLLFTLFFMVKGYIRFSRPERVLSYFGKTGELYWARDSWFILITAFVVFSIPSMLSLSIYMASQWLASMSGSLLSYGVLFGGAAILVVYSIWKTERLFFRYVYYVMDIIPSISLSHDDVGFIERIIPHYQSDDGGFDYAGLNFSNQEDTYYVLSAAEKIDIPVDHEKIGGWIKTTECEGGGFSFVSSGLPRIEATHLALRSLKLLGYEDVSGVHLRWITDHFNGTYFIFPYDTCSTLLQTCYAIISLSILQKLPGSLQECAEWIVNHFSLDHPPREAYSIGMALKHLNADHGILERWIEYHTDILATRLDKNVINGYFYVKVCEAYQYPVPHLTREHALKELEKMKKKYADPIKPHVL